MEGMALGLLPVRPLACLAAQRANAQKYAGPFAPEGKAACFFAEQSYRFPTVARRRTGREGLLGAGEGEGEGLFGWLGAGMTTFGTGRRHEEGQANPTAAAARCQAEARSAYDQSRNVVLFHGDHARDSAFD
jgi:hypothetical protein